MTITKERAKQQKEVWLLRDKFAQTYDDWKIGYQEVDKMIEGFREDLTEDMNRLKKQNLRLIKKCNILLSKCNYERK